MGNSRVWLFRGLVVVAAGLMLISWLRPWWSCDIDMIGVKNGIVIHPWGLETNMGAYTYIVPKNLMPGFFAPFMWAYLGLAMAALLIGAWIKDKSIGLFGRKFDLSRLIIGVVGFTYIVAVIVAVIVMTIRMREFGGLRLLGRTYVILAEFQFSNVDARLLFGYWLACGVGPLLVVLALLRNKIIGKAK
jgi:hypothetical protein